MLNNPLIIYTLFLIITSPKLGFYSLIGSVALFFFLTYFLIFYYRNFKSSKSTPDLSPKFLYLLILTSFLFSYINWFYYLRHGVNDFILFNIVFFVSLLVTFTLTLLKLSKTWKLLLMVLVLLLSLSYRLDLINNNPNPQLDGYQILKHAPLLLLQGKNPYSGNDEYPRIRLADGSMFRIPAYSYGVTPLFLLIPFNYLFKDPRYFFILTELLTALIIFKILGGNNNKFYLSYLLPILYYWHPLSLYIILQGFSEPLMLFLLTLAIYYFFKGRIKLSLVIFSLFINVKQTLLIFPAFLLKKIGKLNILKLILLCLLLMMPFFFWSPKNFLKWGFIFALLDRSIVPVRLSTLTFNSFYNQITGHNFPLFIFVIFWIIIFLFIIKYQKKYYSHVFYASSLFYTAFFFLNYFSYTNYFYFCSLLFYSGITWELRESYNQKQYLKTKNI